jgi:hypothetical protein
MVSSFRSRLFAPVHARSRKLGIFNHNPASKPPTLLARRFLAAVTSDTESSESSDDSHIENASIESETTQRLLQEAEEKIAAQQQSGLSSVYDLQKTQKIVETAMLAAVAGLSYSFATLLKLEGYLSFVLPLPIVLAGLRGGGLACIKALFVAFLLLFILLGPYRAVTYILIYGLLSLALGVSWTLKFPWAISVPLAAVARVIGFLLYFSLSSWISNENLMALMLNNIHNMLDQIAAIVGGSGAPSIAAVGITLASLLLVNALFYVSMMHLLYILILKNMGYETGPLPRFIQSLIGGSSRMVAK